MPFSSADFLLGVVLPALLAGVTLLAVRRARCGPSAGAALAVGGAYVAGHLLQRGWRGFPPSEASDWPWPCAVAGALFGAATLGRRASSSARFVLRLIAAGAAAFVVLAAWRRGAEPATARLTLVVVAAAGALAWSVLEAPRTGASAFLPALLALTAAGAATAIGLSGSVKLALLAGALASVLSAAAIAAGLRLAPPSLEGAVAPSVLTLLSLVVAATFYSDLPRTSALLLAAAPCATWLPRLALGERARRRVVLVLLLLPAAALLLLAIHAAVLASPPWDGADS